MGGGSGLAGGEGPAAPQSSVRWPAALATVCAPDSLETVSPYSRLVSCFLLCWLCLPIPNRACVCVLCRLLATCWARGRGVVGALVLGGRPGELRLNSANFTTCVCVFHSIRRICLFFPDPDPAQGGIDMSPRGNGRGKKNTHRTTDNVGETKRTTAQAGRQAKKAARS